LSKSDLGQRQDSTAFPFGTMGTVLTGLNTAKQQLNAEQAGDVNAQRIDDEEQRTITQICEMLLNEGVEAYKREGPKFMQRLVAKQKARVKES
jgi:hypothetical protein